MSDFLRPSDEAVSTARNGVFYERHAEANAPEPLRRELKRLLKIWNSLPIDGQERVAFRLNATHVEVREAIIDAIVEGRRGRGDRPHLSGALGAAISLWEAYRATGNEPLIGQIAHLTTGQHCPNATVRFVADGLLRAFPEHWEWIALATQRRVEAERNTHSWLRQAKQKGLLPS